jgi:predicted HicB family RNase H-like nuclease
MNMNALDYKGYQGSAEVDLDSGVLHGKLLFVNDLVTYEATTVTELLQQFRAAVDDYVETCRELNREPHKPCSGVFNVRVGPELHRAASVRAMQEGVKLNALVVNALTQYLRDKEIRHTHTHDHQVTLKIVNFTEIKSIQPSTYLTGATQQFEMQTHVTH